MALSLKYYSHYIALFVDVLGQKDKFELCPDPFEKDCLSLQSTKNIFIETNRAVAFVSDMVQKTFEQFATDDSEKIGSSYFSDCMVFYSPLYDKNEKINTYCLYQMLSFMAVAQTRFLAEGITYRGGFEIGIGADNAPGGLYGPISYSVYDLESRIANYPRIVVGDKFRKLIDDIEFYELRMSPDGPSLAQKLKQFYVFRDGAYMIDFLDRL